MPATTASRAPATAVGTAEPEETVPTYQYVCTDCHAPLEVVQAFTDAALTECPACAGRLRKVFGSVGVVFKGSGFYRTDSRAAAGSKDGETSGGGTGGSSTDKAAASASSSPSDTSSPAGASASSGSSGSSSGSASGSSAASAA